MRIDSMSYFTASLAAIRDNQSAISRLNQQIASGNALLAPRDDPLATEKVLQLSNRVAARTQYSSNQDSAQLALNYEQTVTQELEKTLSAARALLNVSPSDNASLRIDINGGGTDYTATLFSGDSTPPSLDRRSPMKRPWTPPRHPARP